MQPEHERFKGQAVNGARLDWLRVVLSRVTSLVAVRTTALGFGMGSLFQETPPCRVLAIVVTVLGGGWKAGHLYQTNHAGSALCGREVAVL